MKPQAKRLQTFQQTVLNYYNAHQRDLPWRKRISPYRVWVSEIMLQQTQASRVTPKFVLFLQTFPSVEKLANASLKEVLHVWSGLGYNRRAKFLHQAAQLIHAQKHFPKTVAEWQALPGIGYATAAAIMVYAYNQPLVYIETNIRAVFLHEFFKDKTDVSDSELLPLIQLSLTGQEPRLWYSALMDYGSYLKSEFGNPNTRSKHHVTQSTFNGSVRQLRGRIIKYLLNQSATIKQLQKEITDLRTAEVVQQLQREGLVQTKGRTFFIK